MEEISVDEAKQQLQQRLENEAVSSMLYIKYLCEMTSIKLQTFNRTVVSSGPHLLNVRLSRKALYLKPYQTSKVVD